ncbi:MAG: hypothetical protein ACD_78C00035G0001, partial [uncultured bacterium (gcode 4)]
MMEDSMVKTTEAPAPTSVSSDSAQWLWGGQWGGVAVDVSNTNLQVAGVDESELIKTDGTYLYFYNSKDHTVYIAKAFPATELSIIKKIKIPESFVEPKLFLQGKKLIILSTKYNTVDYG